MATIMTSIGPVERDRSTESEHRWTDPAQLELFDWKKVSNPGPANGEEGTYHDSPQENKYARFADVR